jgi:hypothetical protein
MSVLRFGGAECPTSRTRHTISDGQLGPVGVNLQKAQNAIGGRGR